MKDLGPVFVPGDVVYQKLAIFPWPGIVTGDHSEHFREVKVLWWDAAFPKVCSAHTITTRKPRLLPFLARVGLLVSAFCLGGWLL